MVGGEDLSPPVYSVGWRREDRLPQAMADGATPNPYAPHTYSARPGLCGPREPTPASEAAVPAAKKKKMANLKPAATQHAHISWATLSEHSITISTSDQRCTFSHKPKVRRAADSTTRLEPGLGSLGPLRRIGRRWLRSIDLP